tara:strand:- start:4985 stop:5467 length:483 start_codon:yes stop_codon:yes gene_type:complete
MQYITAMASTDDLLHVLQCKGLTLQPVVGDGACQFRAISAQLYDGNQEMHNDVRATIVQQLQNNPTLYEKFVIKNGTYKTYCEHMALSSTWGNHTTLHAAADAYGATFVVTTVGFEQPDDIVIVPTALKLSENPRYFEGKTCNIVFYVECHYASTSASNF